MEKLNNFNQEEKDFIINLGLFSYQQHEEFFNNKLSNKYLSNNLEASFTNSNIELMNEIEKLKEDIIFHIENKKIPREKIDVLYKHIIKNHSNKIRCKQFKEIILKEIS